MIYCVLWSAEHISFDIKTNLYAAETWAIFEHCGKARYMEFKIPLVLVLSVFQDLFSTM